MTSDFPSLRNGEGLGYGGGGGGGGDDVFFLSGLLLQSRGYLISMS